MTPFHEYFYPIFGSGLAIATIASIVAGLSRGVLVPVIFLIVGVLSFWAGLFIGSEIGYQVWQGIPDPPPEAFADTFPMGALFAGWIPAGVYCAATFGLAGLARILLFQKRSRSEHGVSSSIPVESGNPYQSPTTSTDG